MLAIGRPLCIEAVKRGAFVYCVDRDPTALANLQNEVIFLLLCLNYFPYVHFSFKIQIGAEHLKGIQCELGDWKGTRATLEAAIPRSVAVRDLVNLAGVFRGDPFDKISEENFD